MIKTKPTRLGFLCSEECLSLAKLAFDSFHGLGGNQCKAIPPILFLSTNGSFAGLSPPMKNSSK